MVQAGQGGTRATGWLIWAVAGLLVAGLVTAGLRVADGDRPGEAVVTAAGGQSTTVDVTSTVTAPVPSIEPSTPATTQRTTTTLPKAAVDVLNALASTTTTRRPATTTTSSPAPTPTTVAPTTSTSSTLPPRFAATLVNGHPSAVVLVVNGQEFPLAPAQTIEAELPMSSRGDVVQVRLAEDRSCGVTDSGEIFRIGARFRVGIVEGPVMCGSFASPFLEISRLP